MEEVWLPVIGWEGRQEVSNLGRVRTLDHVVIRKNGRPWPNKAKILRPWKKGSVKNGKRKEYWCVTLSGQVKRKVAILVLEAFIGPKPFDAAVSRHLNDESLDDRLENLAWGSKSDDLRDCWRNSRR